MANFYKESNGRYCVQFMAVNGKRYSVRLGTASPKTAEYARVRIEHLVIATKYGHPLDGDTAKWLAGLDDKTHERLAKTGLVPHRERKETALAGFIDAYIASRVDAKATTRIVFERVRKHLVGHFGKNRAMQSITKGEADAWRLYLVGKGLADNTVRRHCGIAKQLFRVAIRRELIDRDPFADIVSAVRGSSEERRYFVSRKEASAVLEHCIDAEWRAMFALARYAGLRCPSEVLGLRLRDINWEQGRMMVRSPKTERHEGKASRQVPIFPELHNYLLDAYNAAPVGAEYLINRYRDPAVNLRTQLERTIEAAGLKPWPKLWHNLRATRQTELAEQHPIHVVCAWIGNSQAIAQEHYLQVRDEDFAKALQNPVQSGSETTRTPSGDRQDSPSSTRKHLSTNELVGVGGLEPSTLRV